MRSQLPSRVYVCAADSSIQPYVDNDITTGQVSVECWPSLGSLEHNHHPGASGAIVIVLDADSPSALSDALCFDAVMAGLPALRRTLRHVPVILVHNTPLSIQQCCQAAQAGMAALISRHDADFRQRLNDHLRSALKWSAGQIAKTHSTPDADGLRTDDRNGLVGNSAALNRVIERARRAAKVSDAPVVISGPSGTGKQKIAELIHQWDPKRNAHSFICVNCAAITGTLAESELFGHIKGAFTGATDNRPGYFRSAHHGTILLDEVSELPLHLQSKILRVLQEGRVLPVGGDHEHSVDVRVLASTNRPLDAMVENGAFRLDLYQRLAVIQLDIPSLKQRKEDIPALFEAFLDKYGHYCSTQIHSVDPRVYTVLGQTLGAGNIRELENVVRQMLAFKEHGHHIGITDLPEHLLDRMDPGQVPDTDTPCGTEIPDTLIESLLAGRIGLHDVMDDYECRMLTYLMARSDNHSQLARRLGITRRTLYNKLNKHHLSG